MKIVVQNIQKRSYLGGALIDEYDPDVLLLQEVDLYREDPRLVDESRTAWNTNWFGCGTAIYCPADTPSNVRRVDSPHPEIVHLIYKKTTIANCYGIDFVSFHAYNGQPAKSVAKLLDHVRAVVAVICPDGPAVFAGDFNTWSEEHVTAVAEELKKVGLVLAASWPYPGREVPLDHVFLRDLELENFCVYSNASDHKGAVFELITRNSKIPTKKE